MKTRIRKYWLGTATIQRVKLKEYGFVDQTRFYIFGFRGLGFTIGNNPVEVETDNSERHLRDLEEMAMAQILAERPLPHLVNEDFDRFQREIYPTRF